MISRRRFDYYFAVNAAIIIAYVIVRLSTIIPKGNFARLAIIAVAIISLPLIKSSTVQASLDYGYPPQSWVNTCRWLQTQNTPEYERAYYTGSKPSYGTFSWWSYGYWLEAIGHQAVYSNNGTGDCNGNSQILLSSSDSYSISKLRQKGIRYIIISQDMFNSNSLRASNPTTTFMYHAYTNQVADLKFVHQSNDIKTFEIKGGIQ
jgi:asparagine N-glycosylation enzyme membrane subunit Stt3